MQTRVLIRLLGQQIQQEMHLKSTKSLSLHLPVCVYTSLCPVSMCLFTSVCGHTSAFTCMYTSAENTPQCDTLQEEITKTKSQQQMLSQGQVWGAQADAQARWQSGPVAGKAAPVLPGSGRGTPSPGSPEEAVAPSCPDRIAVRSWNG